MKDTLLYILGQIVDNPQALSVDETTDQNGIILTIHADPGDLGKIIGKGGRIIRAIRDLIKIIATKENRYVNVVIAEQAS